jgi:hypothetical protein
MPDLANEQSWDGWNYSVQDSMGSRGTFCFQVSDAGQPTCCAGAVFSLRSDRRSLTGHSPDEPLQFFVGAGADQTRLARMAFRYLLEDFDGRPLPWVTAGLWSEDGNLVSQDTWSIFLQHGGHLLERQVLPTDDAIDQWMQYYSFDEQETEVVRSLLMQKLQSPAGWHTLSEEQYEIIKGNSVGVDESCESFAELRIKFPLDR